MARSNFVHFRVDPDTLDALDELVAQTPNGNRSQVLRDMILQTAFKDPERRAAVLQASFDYSRMQRIVFGKLSSRMSEIIPVVVAEALAESE